MTAPAERWSAYLVCLAGWLFDFYDLVLFAYVAKAVGLDLGWGADFNRDKALLIGLSLGASGLGGVLFGALADRYGRRAVMAWTVLIYSIGTGLSGLACGVLSLALFRCLTGFGVGGEWATGHAIMAEMFPKDQRGQASALLQIGEPLGVALAVLVGLMVEPSLGWRAVFLISALPATLVLVIRRHLPESALWERARGERTIWAQYALLWREHRRRAAQGLVLGCSKLGTYWLTYVWLPDYFAELERGGAAPGFGAVRLKFILVAQGGQLLGMLGFGRLADRVGRRPAFTLYSALTAAGLLALSRFGPQMILRPSLFWPAMGAVGLGSGCTAGFGALLAELFPTPVRNTAMGTVYNLSRSFQFVPQLLMGAIASRAGGVSAGLLLAAGFALVTGTWIWTFPETRGLALAE